MTGMVRAREADIQRQAVRRRSGGRCEFLRPKFLAHAGRFEFQPCGARADHTAHLYRRWKCGAAIFDPVVALNACAECHKLYDTYQREMVQAPIDLLRAAWDAILAVSKSAYRDTDGVVIIPGCGPRP